MSKQTRLQSFSNPPAMTTRLMFILAAACGLIVANLYYAQPLVGPISQSAGISPSASGLIVTMTQIGYVIGLLFIVPLSDLVENRRLVSMALGVAAAGLTVAALANGKAMFFAASVLIGAGSVGAQILVPYAASLASADQRGRIVGNIMSGLLLGIMLARPAASLTAGMLGWRAVFLLSAVLMGLMIMLLLPLLPKRIPQSGNRYPEILQSLWQLLQTKPVLRRRALYQACLFGSFSLFWTVVPLWLSDHFHASQNEIAVFALVGVAGAVAAPIAGRLADKGWTRRLTGIAIVTAGAAFLLTHAFAGNRILSVILFGAAAILLDMAVSGNLVLGQQAIYALGDEIRGRVNGLFMAIFFAGGALGSAVGGWTYAHGSWMLASLAGLTLPVLALLYYLTELPGKSGAAGKALSGEN
ncbi:MAG: arabinose efflux permease family protein [Paenibacillaceae bacterium]|nr:arabinose efflux permease family protein [Paenibacillaceae bacterium]